MEAIGKTCLCHYIECTKITYYKPYKLRSDF